MWAGGSGCNNQPSHTITIITLFSKQHYITLGAGKVEGVRINDPEPKSYTLPHPIWSQEELEGVRITHDPPKDKTETVSERVRGERGGEREGGFSIN